MSEENGCERSPFSSNCTPLPMSGALFGQYRIEGPLGAGAMGEVWRAVDTRLGREVALKLLPADFDQDPERHTRFEREAQMLASLNHPNIATLYGLEHLHRTIPPKLVESPGEEDRDPRPVHILVMELIEGEDLDQIIKRGPLPFDEAVANAIQITEGLQAAHERGIVHRDLKPANIKVRPDGTVKILDFGLATTRAEAKVNENDSQSPTRSQRHTVAGTVLGTYAYMSPEQARGKPVDARSDIWAFGCILYEMLTASKAFGGETLSDVMAAVLKDEPDWSRLPGDLAPVAHHVLRRCLAKDPARRFHDIADVRIELEECLTELPPTGVHRRWRVAVPWWIAIGVTAALSFAIFTWTTESRPVESLPTFKALNFSSGRVGNARFAPDGMTVVFGASNRGNRLVLQSTRVDSVESRPLELPPADVLGIADNGRMALLLDRHHEGSWVSVGTLAEADLAGGASRPLLKRVNDGDISPDGTRMAIAREVGNSQVLEYPQGRVLFKTQGWISDVRISPNAQQVAFLHHPFYGDDRGLVVMVDLEGTVTELSEESSDSLQGLAWAPDGGAIWFSAFVFGRGGVLRSVRPGESSVEHLVAPVNIRLKDIRGDGRMLIKAGNTSAEIAGLLAGQSQERGFEGWNDDSIAGLALDASVFAGNIQEATVNGEYAVYARTADGSVPVRLGYGDVCGMSPDGSWVYVRKMTSEKDKLILLPTGADEQRVIDLHGVRPEGSGMALITFTLDGMTACFSGYDNGVGPRMFILDVGDGTLRPLGPVGTEGPVISPDGQWVAALSPERLVTIYPVGEGQPYLAPGLQPHEYPIQWTRDGHSLLVWDRAFPARIQAVDLEDGALRQTLEISPGNPGAVLYGQILMTPGGEYYVYRCRRDASTLFLAEGIR